jgi:dCMP deaminase
MISKWDVRFIGLAKQVASWSRDPSTQVGCVIVRPDKTIVSLGFNGLPRGVKDYTARYQDRDTKLAMTVHAELNAVLSAHGSVSGCTAYVWPFSSCSHCAGALIQAGIREVVSPRLSEAQADRWSTSLAHAWSMFDEAGVEVRYLLDTPEAVS